MRPGDATALLKLSSTFHFPSLLVAITISLAEQSVGGDTSTTDDCRICRFLVKSFREGLDRTEKLHFGGGNTDWEERKLGSFRTSETRFLESMEYACRKDTDLGYDSSVKDAQFKCHAMAEEHEETMEEWYFRHQDSGPQLEDFLCVERIRKCCPEGHFGAKCIPCPGLAQSERACFGRGTCSGSGTRQGQGKCSCETGYVGKMCSNCDSTHFALSQNSSHVECAECYTGCAGGCTAAGPVGCRNCRHGWVKEEGAGCVDIDECLEEEKRCTNEHEKCVNTEGHFKCECEDGYRRDGDGDCEPDIEEPSAQTKAEEGDEASLSTVPETNGEERDDTATIDGASAAMEENEQELLSFRTQPEEMVHLLDWHAEGEL